MSFFRLSGCAATILALCVALPATTQSQSLSAQESDPNVMGWMQGFPPPEDKIITQPDSIYFSFPRLRWSVCHLREFLPTEEISRGLGAPNPLNYVSSQDFDLAQCSAPKIMLNPRHFRAQWWRFRSGFSMRHFRAQSGRRDHLRKDPRVATEAGIPPVAWAAGPACRADRGPPLR